MGYIDDKYMDPVGYDITKHNYWNNLEYYSKYYCDMTGTLWIVRRIPCLGNRPVQLKCV